MSIRILIHEESFANLQTVKSFLVANGFELYSCDHTLMAAEKENQLVDIILIDFNELGVTSLQTVRLLRSLYHAPVIGLISLEYANHINEISQLKIQQVIFKPYHPEQLATSIRHCNARQTSADSIKWKNGLVERRFHNRRKSQLIKSKLLFSLNPNSREIVIDNKVIRLTPKEFELLFLLASDMNRFFSSEEILTKVWDDNSCATDSDVQQYIRLLRKKIEKNPSHPHWIETHRGFGYRLNNC